MKQKLTRFTTGFCVFFVMTLLGLIVGDFIAEGFEANVAGHVIWGVVSVIGAVRWYEITKDGVK